MIRISAQSLNVIQSRTEAEIAQWVAQGFLNLVCGAEVDPFAPHSFVHLAGHPVEGIEALYQQAPLPVKAGIRKGIAMLGPLCRAKSADAEGLALSQRFSLLQEFLRLCNAVRCFEAAKSIALIACNDEAYWGEELFRATIYPLCLNCLEEIALAFYETAFSIEPSASEQLYDGLRRVACAPAFKAQYAPRMLASLISITPDHFVDHLHLLSVPMSALHRHDPMELDLAYKTAHRLVKLALPQLEKQFSRLDIGRPSSPDLWLLTALFAAEGPLRYYRETENTIVVCPFDQLEVQLLFTHPDLSRVNLPMATLPRPAVTPSTTKITDPYWKGSPEYFDASNKAHIVFKPSTSVH